MRCIAVTHAGRSVSKSAMIRARVEPELKDRAEAMLEELGLTATSAITLFYRQIIERRGLPFELRLPNATTRRDVQGCGQHGSVKGVKVGSDFHTLCEQLLTSSAT